MNTSLNVSLVLAAGIAAVIIVAAAFFATPQPGRSAVAAEQNQLDQNGTTTSQISPGADLNATDSSQNQTMMPSGPTINPVNGAVVLRGTVSSLGDPADPSFNAVDLLPPNMEGSVYSGTLTFTASKPVLVGIYQPYEVTNSSMINPAYGEPFSFPIDEQGNKLAITVIEPQYGEFAAPSATIPFVGSGVTVATLDTQPFIVTYAISAEESKPQVYNNVESAILNMTTEPEREPENSVSIVLGATPLGDQAYSPNPVIIRMGETITWVNDDFEQHTVTSGTSISDPSTGDEFESYILSQGGTFEHTFDERGEFDYYCQIHPTMTGQVIVR